ncbi:hypothetical protein LY78DRAFT_659872 [Colletotrichum sublineola]|nr:hypothetical protein LY78DRAFT_659872 [Colletotrichum sublineola]
MEKLCHSHFPSTLRFRELIHEAQSYGECCSQSECAKANSAGNKELEGIIQSIKSIERHINTITNDTTCLKLEYIAGHMGI